MLKKIPPGEHREAITTPPLFQRANKIILDTLFPIRCIVCESCDVWICNKCFKKIKLLEAQVCPYCEKNSTPAGKICAFCKEKFLTKSKAIPLDHLVVAAKYKEPGISHMIHLFKYRFIQDLHEPLGRIMVKSIIESNLPLPDLIIPVPLHKKRIRWRGFNQSELLANFISQNLAQGFEIPVCTDILSRKKYTIPQMKIRNYSQRKKNLQNVFVLDEEKINLIKDKKILLIDDVATTGSTILECGRILKAGKAHKIYASVIARQEWKNVL
jgi:competence protein ComFC